MVRPTDVSNFGEAVYSQLAPLADLDEANDWPLLIIVGAIGEMFKFADDLAHSSPAWSNMVNPDLCPVEGLPWLGQLIGVNVNINLTEAQQRQQIKDHLGWNRGSVPGIKATIKPYLTGTQTVVILERDTSPYHFTINTYSTETPPDKTLEDIFLNYATFQAFFIAFATIEAYWLTDTRNQIRATIELQAKPAGLQYVYSVLPGSPP